MAKHRTHSIEFKRQVALDIRFRVGFDLNFGHIFASH